VLVTVVVVVFVGEPGPVVTIAVGGTGIACGGDFGGVVGGVGSFVGADCIPDIVIPLQLAHVGHDFIVEV